jgi:hypothetical protein
MASLEDPDQYVEKVESVLQYLNELGFTKAAEAVCEQIERERRERERTAEAQEESHEEEDESPAASKEDEPDYEALGDSPEIRRAHGRVDHSSPAHARDRADRAGSNPAQLMIGSACR